MSIAFYTQAIQDVLQRAPATGEAEGYNLQETGGTPRADVVATIVNSLEAQMTVWPVVGLYSNIYGRVPDKLGLDFWVDSYRAVQVSTPDNPGTGANEPFVALARPFVDPAQTPEFATNFGANPSPAAFIAATYSNVLGRSSAGDPGATFWEGVYNTFFNQAQAAGDAAPAITARAMIMDEFIRSAEFHQNFDASIVDFLTGAAQIPDPPGHYTGPLPVAIDPAQIFTLTTGIDTPVGGSGDDTFRAVNSNTLQSADVLDGKDGFDTLEISSSGFVNGTAPIVQNIERILNEDVSTLDFNLMSGVAEVWSTGAAGVYDYVNASLGVVFGAANATAKTIDIAIKESTAGSNDTLKLALDDNGAATATFTSTADATSIENLAIFANGTSGGLLDFANVNDFNQVKAISIHGDGDIFLTANMLTKLTSLDLGGLKGDSSVNVTGSTKDMLFTGGTGNDFVQFGTGKITATGGGGNDTLLATNSAKATLDGGSGNDIVRGGNGADNLKGGSGNDTLIGGAGGDTMEGGSGDDTYFVDSNILLLGQHDIIVGFVSSDDEINFGGPAGVFNVTYKNAAAQASYVDAWTAANAIFDGTVRYVEVGVGADTYIFYDSADANTLADMAVRLVGTSAAQVSSTDVVD